MAVSPARQDAKAVRTLAAEGPTAWHEACSRASVWKPTMFFLMAFTSWSCDMLRFALEYFGARVSTAASASEGLLREFREPFGEQFVI